MKAILFVLAVLLFSGCVQNSITEEQIQFTIEAKTSDGTNVYSHEVNTYSGTTLFDALNENDAPFEYTDTAYGALLTGLGGVTPEDDEYLAILINGEYATEGISTYIPKNGDLITIIPKKIDSYTIE